MQDVYDFLHDINTGLLGRNLRRLEDVARAQLLSGLLSDLLTDALANHSRSLVVNTRHNGHPDLVVAGKYPNDAVQNGAWDSGVEVKSTNKRGGAVDTHGAREQWQCVFVYETDKISEPASMRAPTRFTEIYLAHVRKRDFRENARNTAIGTRTATIGGDGLAVLRRGWVYRDKV